NGVIATCSYTVTQPPSLTVTTSQNADIMCHGGSISITVSANGGVSPYNGTGTFTVNAGNYSYTVTDANNCLATSSIIITEPSTLTVTISAGIISCHGGTTTLSVSASGGTLPYSGTGTFTVTEGSYNYVVTDANGCSASASTLITEPSVLFASCSGT